MSLVIVVPIKLAKKILHIVILVIQNCMLFVAILKSTNSENLCL